MAPRPTRDDDDRLSLDPSTRDREGPSHHRESGTGTYRKPTFLPSVARHGLRAHTHACGHATHASCLLIHAREKQRSHAPALLLAPRVSFIATAARASAGRSLAILALAYARGPSRA